MGYLKRDIISNGLHCVSRNIFRICKVGIEAGQLYDLSIKQDLFHLKVGGGGVVGNGSQNFWQIMFDICDHAAVTAAKLREKA